MAPGTWLSCNDALSPVIYTLSLHDALPISELVKMACGATAGTISGSFAKALRKSSVAARAACGERSADRRSEEHTSELQSLRHLVCRLLLEKKKNVWTDILRRPTSVPCRRD